MNTMRKRFQIRQRFKSTLILISAALWVLTLGCSTVRMTETQRSAKEQQLLVLALERAVAQLDVQKYAGKKVALDLYGLFKDDLPFAKEYVNVWLEQNGLQVVQHQKEADIKLKAFAKVLAVDQSETLLGTPHFVFLGIPVPAIAIYRNVRNRGRAEIQLYAYDEGSEKLVDEIPEGIGESKHDRFTIFFVINWTKSDLEKAPRKEFGLK